MFYIFLTIMFTWTGDEHSRYIFWKLCLIESSQLSSTWIYTLLLVINMHGPNSSAMQSISARYICYVCVNCGSAYNEPNRTILTTVRHGMTWMPSRTWQKAFPCWWVIKRPLSICERNCLSWHHAEGEAANKICTLACISDVLLGNDQKTSLQKIQTYFSY